MTKHDNSSSLEKKQTVVDRRRVWFVVPAYNEEGRISEVLNSILRSGYRCLVIDDGSDDDTFGQANQSEATALKHLQNLGQGASLNTAFNYLRERDFDYCVTFDADGQHSLDEATNMIQFAHEGGQLVTLGSRFIEGAQSNPPLLRRIVLRLGVWFSRLHSGLHVSDTHNGLRVISKEAIAQISLSQPRMAHASEFLLEIQRKGLSWREYPVNIRYSEESLRKGQKSLSGASTILIDLMLGKFK